MTLEPHHKSLTIQRWARDDIDYVSKSVSREGWGHTKRDIERCWELEPNGCFIAHSQNKPVGHVFSICYGKIGWIGLLIVNPESRNQGVGSFLMETALKYLQNAGAETVKLEAAQEAVPLYRRIGFVEEFDSLRFHRQSLMREKLQPRRGSTFQMRDSDLADVAQFDAPFFGAKRLAVLQSLYNDHPQLCLVAKRKGNIVGYIMARQTKDGFWIGPWVCLDSTIALHLFHSLVKIVGNRSGLRVGLPASNASGQRLMEKLGFGLISKSAHMVLGDRRNQSVARRIYSIGGPEKG